MHTHNHVNRCTTQRTAHACATLKCIAYSFFDVHCIGRLNSTRLVLLHFPDPVIVLSLLKFCPSFSSPAFSRPRNFVQSLLKCCPSFSSPAFFRPIVFFVRHFQVVHFQRHRILALKSDIWWHEIY